MLIWAALAALLLFSAVTYSLGRRRLAPAAGAGRTHSRPGYHAAYVVLWTAVPAMLTLFAVVAFGGRLEGALLRADTPAIVQTLTPAQVDVFFDDARALAHAGTPSQTQYDGELKDALHAKTAQARGL